MLEKKEKIHTVIKWIVGILNKINAKTFTWSALTNDLRKRIVVNHNAQTWDVLVKETAPQANPAFWDTLRNQDPGTVAQALTPEISREQIFSFLPESYKNTLLKSPKKVTEKEIDAVLKQGFVSSIKHLTGQRKEGIQVIFGILQRLPLNTLLAVDIARSLQEDLPEKDVVLWIQQVLQRIEKNKIYEIKKPAPNLPFGKQEIEVFHYKNLPLHFWTSFDRRPVEEIAPYLRKIISFTQIYRVIHPAYYAEQGLSFEQVFEKIFAREISSDPEDFLAVYSLFPEDPESESDWNEERIVTLIAMDLIRRNQTHLPKHLQAQWMKELAQNILLFRKREREYSTDYNF